MITFFVHGEPATAGSKRAFPIYRKDKATGERIFTGKVSLVNDSRKGEGKPYRAAVQAAALDELGHLGHAAPAIPQGVAVRVRLLFVLPRPASVSPKRRPFPTVKPDDEKLSRAVSDALKHIVWHDDAQVVTRTITKRYQDARHRRLEHVGTWIEIEREPLPGQVPANVHDHVQGPTPGKGMLGASPSLPGLG